ncbi:uncharacterized protein LOC134664535 isoform X2 [Cydia fagiglandana]|uniref:uncharacterized protein LOC134664535 isoform X2 n=1 Tax=Cydia fagiglandana TaxID=1458189 RepID=UPI002FEDEC92
MASKPATPAAARGVPGAPRVLVYVADSRQLEPGAAAPAEPPPLYPHDLPVALPRNALFRTQSDAADRNPPNTIFYKPLNNDGKLNSYGSGDSLVQRTDFFPVAQQFMKESLKLDENKSVERQSNIVVRRDCSNSSINSEVCGVESYNSRVPLESGELATYQTRCPVPGVSDNAVPLQPIVVQHGFNQFTESGSVNVNSEGRNSDRELVDKSFVNYQFLEQSVSHQSIVNQSISILNQQVGVSRVSEGEGPQLVRTPDGLVLAVLPSTAPQPDSSELSSRTAQSESSQTIIVPLGWRRIVSGTSVLYISPSGTALSTLPQLREYLQTAGTCKCGLPCPLRPETTFSFDSKVVSKPYQAASGAELTKLCNHKRKLLATLQARAQSPSTPPPIADQKKVGTELNALKKKMKKRAYPNMSVSQLMVQRERPLADFKGHENEHGRTVSPGLAGAPYPPAAPAPLDDKHELAPRPAHYLTVNSGWITQHQETQDPTKQNQPSAVQNPLNVGMPVLGTNGQIIGVNTGYSKHPSFKNVAGAMQPSQEQKEEKKEHGLPQQKPPAKEDESQIFCGLNQPLTPEVMQKINEQQQLFIQQNQKQIEMAMKGYRTQLAESANQNKLQGQNQYVPQGQLVIQNGAVVKTNPAKTPPWQVKRTDAAPNPMSSPSPKPLKLDNVDYEEPMNISDDASAGKNNYVNNDAMNPAMCPRVPPLPQHYNMISQHWPHAEMSKKKMKNNNKGSKKKNNGTENKIITFNNGMRLVQESKGKSCEDMSGNSVPSFMDDPNGYLAQQTVLLNNTISRQVGINSSFDGGQYENANNCYPNNQPDKSFKTLNKSCDMNVYRSNMVPNASPSPNNTPDSSVLSDKTQDGALCCKGCNVYKGNGADFSENQMRVKYMKHNMYKMEIDGNRGDARLAPSPSHFDDNPVSSSTFLERSPAHDTQPIQAGTVSTSNGSPSEKLPPPEPSPTPSNSSRNTDTPHSNGSGGSQFTPNCTFPVQSPAYSGAGSYRDNSNPPTPGGQPYQYHSPGPPASQSITGTQMMHFISNHNVNKNLMEVDNISMVGVKPGLKLPQEIFRVESRKRIENSMPGYCPPPHLGGGPAHSLVQSCYVQTFVTTMASGFSVTRDTVTSVLAGKANTATTSINASQINFIRPPPPPSVNLATTYAIPNNQPDPFINSVNLPTSYPLHIAGTTAQNMISKSPLEMVQNVIGNGPAKPETSGSTTPIQMNRRPCPPTTPGQILISSTGQIIVSNNQMPPPPPKTTMVASPIQGSSTNVTASVAQLVPAAGPPVVNQVVVNTLPTPFVIQPPMMAVDGQVVQPNTMLPQIVAGGLVPGQSPGESPRQMDVSKGGAGFMPGVAMLSPESLKKRNKKKKTSASITNVLQITAPQQNSNNIMVHHTSPQQSSSPQFSPRGFQLSPNNNISPAPMLQALTIVPGKSGTPAHIVMNGQGNSSNFGSQQIIANTSPSQQINLLQPVNLINNASNVMPNFPAFQQFIVPNIGGMVMTADGTIIQDNSNGMPMQLQLQTVNGQNVLTPVQNPGVFAAGANGGVVIRAQNQQGKIIQSQHSPGAQFLSPNSQVMMNSPNFNGQLSPLLANLSPTNVAFNAQQVRPGNVQQEFIQTNQMGQTLMVPLSPKQSLAPTNRTNTFVQQNTTIVQQQTTLVSNSQTHSSIALGGGSRLSIDPNVLLASKQIQKRNSEPPPSPEKEEKFGKFPGEARFGGAAPERAHSVSTQTLLARKSPGGSPPDTTTHSPADPARSPRYPSRPDTTTAEPDDPAASAMVQCVSSSEQDMAESREHAWPAPRPDFSPDTDAQNVMSNLPLMRQNRNHNPVESTEMHYNQNVTPPANQQNLMPLTTNYYERTHTFKRKNDFGDGSSYRTDKMMRTNYGMVHGLPKEDYDLGIASPDKQVRHFPPSGTSSDSSAIQKVFDRHNLGSGNDNKSGEESDGSAPGGLGPGGLGPGGLGPGGGGARSFSAGELVWGPVGGHASWPGALRRRAPDGRWRVRWFGAPRPAALLPAHQLLTLDEGLEAHHAARTKHRKSRKLNTLLENAIQEAMAELDKKSESAAASGRSSPAAPDAAAAATGDGGGDAARRRRRERPRSRDKHRKGKAAAAKPDTRLRSSR